MTWSPPKNSGQKGVRVLSVLPAALSAVFIRPHAQRKQGGRSSVRLRAGWLGYQCLLCVGARRIISITSTFIPHVQDDPDEGARYDLSGDPEMQVSPGGGTCVPEQHSLCVDHRHHPTAFSPPER